MIKSRAAKGKARVTFTVDPRVGAQAAAVCGEWNDWSADAGVIHRDAEGGFSLTVDLDAGRAYRFRYLLDGQRWDNDWAAQAYVANDFGGDDSVLDLTAGRGGPADREASVGEEGTGEEGGADAGRHEGSRARGEASRQDGEASREDGEIARAGRCCQCCARLPPRARSLSLCRVLLPVCRRGSISELRRQQGLVHHSAAARCGVVNEITAPARALGAACGPDRRRC